MACDVTNQYTLYSPLPAYPLSSDQPSPFPPSISEDSMSNRSIGSPGIKRGRQKMSPWLFDQINSGEVPGLVWLDQGAQIFKIPWKHFGRPGVSGVEDAILFRRWAEHTGKFQQGEPPNPSGWKTNFRCALGKLKDIRYLPERNQSGDDPYRVFQFVQKRLETEPCSGTCKREQVDYSKAFDENDNSSLLKNINNQSNLNFPKSEDDLDLPDLNGDLNACFDDMSFIDEIIEGGDRQTSNYGYACANNTQSSENLLQSIQSLSASQNVPTGELSSIKVKLYYADIEVGMQVVANPYGLRIAFRPPPPLPQDIVEGNTQRLNDIYGPSQADQIYFPPTEDMFTTNILEYLGRGLVLQAQNGQIFATRLSQAKVFCSDSPTACEKMLPREQTIVLFDYANDFYPKFKLFEAGEGPTPSFDRYFCFMEPWSEKSPLTSKHVRVTVTHCWSEKMFHQYQTRNCEFFFSAPNDRDVAACQIELVAQQSGETNLNP